MKTAINNGLFINPKTNVCAKLNIAFEDGKITEITDKYITGDKIIDASGMCITPGFIDIHMHEDPIENGKIKIKIFERMLKMGVTTAIGGNCGVGVANIEKYLKSIDDGFIINYGSFLPHKILRDYIGAKNRYENIDLESIEKMYNHGKKLIEDNGLFGISFGIEYIPGIDFNELITLSKLGEGKIISAHLRDDGENIFQSLDEFLKINDYVKTHLQISHIGSMAGYGQMKEFLNIIEKVKNVTCDCYPYTAFSTHIGTAVFDNFIEKYNADYKDLEILEGEYKGKRCTKEIFEKLRNELPDTLVAGHLMTENDIKLALSNSKVVIASDGLLGEEGNGHPRATGTFPRFISKYVRDGRLISLVEGIRKITSYPAEILGIDKGNIEIGADADITIFSLDQLKDNATFEKSDLSADGIKYVFVNGVLALENGKILNSISGKSIRKF